MYKLAISEFAHADLDNIVSYIAERLAAPQAAADFLDELERCYDYLQDNPLIYEYCHDFQLRKEGYRNAPIKGYVLIYKVDEPAKIVNVYRFFHGTQDYINLI